MPELLTVEELADLVRCTPAAIYVQHHRGQAPGALGFKAGRRILYRRSDLEAWFDSRAAQSLARVQGQEAGE